MAQSKAEMRIQQFASWLDAHPEADAAARRAKVHAALEFVGATYRPQTLTCPTLLVCIGARRKQLFDPERGLERLLQNCESVIVDYSHHAIFHERINDTAAAIQRFLDRVAPLTAT
jgi:pimeloyl-ACP methyl ester carboxylesterase